MNNHEDISKRRGGEEVELPENVRDTLPVLLFADNSPPSAAPRRRSRGILVFSVFLLFIAIGALVLSSLSSGEVLVLSEGGTQENTVTDEWRGAFESREVYENALAVSVSIRLGKRSEARYFSGVVLASDGIIATAIDDADMLDAPMYVLPSSGGEYAVTSVELDRECGLALLKIPADALKEASVAEYMPQVGESVISIASSVSEGGRTLLRACDISAIDENETNSICFELDRLDIPAGSPIFNESGGLLAIVGKKGADKQAKAVSVAKCRSCIKAINDREN